MELTDEQKKRLREWWEPKRGDMIISDKDSRVRIIGDPFDNHFATQFHPFADLLYATDLIPLRVCLPLLSIGQMIELVQNNKTPGETFQIGPPGGLINTWGVWYGVCHFPKKYENLELADALWQAVKEVL